MVNGVDLTIVEVNAIVQFVRNCDEETAGMAMKGVLLVGVDPKVKRLAKEARTWMASEMGKKAVEEIAKRAQTAENDMREAQRIDTKPLCVFHD